MRSSCVIRRATSADVGPGDVLFPRAAYYDGEKYQKLDIEDDEDQALSRSITGGWVAALQHHFVAAIVPAPGQAYQYGLRVKDQDFTAGRRPARAAARRASTFGDFVGPKLQDNSRRLADRGRPTGLLTILPNRSSGCFRNLQYVGNWDSRSSS
jgi:YidC/Oxa1 family membrane protein insertase